MIREKATDLIATQDDILRRKCQQALKNHRQRAKADSVTLDYGTLDLIELAKRWQTCEYCLMSLDWDWQFDHRTPLSRGPHGHRLDNLAVVCGDCNRMKGQLDEEDYRWLLGWLARIDPRGAADVRHRLKAGGAVHVRGRKR